jgi:hypothetical protein
VYRKDILQASVDPQAERPKNRHCATKIGA